MKNNIWRKKGLAWLMLLAFVFTLLPAALAEGAQSNGAQAYIPVLSNYANATAELVDAGGNVIQTIHLQAGQPGNFSLNVTSEGSTQYTVRLNQENSEANKVLYDQTVYNVTVTGYKNNTGKLYAVPEIHESTDPTGPKKEQAMFNSKPYIDPPVKKVVEGEPATDETFTFVLKSSDGAPMPEGSEDGEKTSAVTGTGETEFGIIAFDAEGTYTYTITEKAGDAANYTYDVNIYTVTATVSLVDNALIADYTITRNDSVATEIVFTNKYEEPIVEPTTAAPTTAAPTTAAPTTAAPTTAAPTTVPPTTAAPTTAAPTTAAPTTAAPTTATPTTAAPTTAAPTTAAPTTAAPTTATPTTAAPTTAAPTTAAPTTATPTTAAPTTVPPTTAAPEETASIEPTEPVETPTVEPTEPVETATVEPTIPPESVNPTEPAESVSPEPTGTVTPEPTATPTITPTSTTKTPASVTSAPVSTPTPAPTTSVQGEKVWVDDNNAHGIRPSSVTIELLADGSLVASQTVRGRGNRWSFSFEGLPLYNSNGSTISYSLREVSVAHYTSTVSGTTITNRIDPPEEVPLIRVEGVKSWNDSGNAGGTRPDSTVIYLLRDGAQVDSRTILEANGWRYTFDNLPTGNGYGHSYTYSVREAGVPGYFQRVDGYNITNTLLEELPPEEKDSEPTEVITQLTEEELEKLLLLFDYSLPLWGGLLRTGDTTPTYIYVLIGCGALAVLIMIALVVVYRRRRRSA